MSTATLENPASDHLTFQEVREGVVHPRPKTSSSDTTPDLSVAADMIAQSIQGMSQKETAKALTLWLHAIKSNNSEVERLKAECLAKDDRIKALENTQSICYLLFFRGQVYTTWMHDRESALSNLRQHIVAQDPTAAASWPIPESSYAPYYLPAESTLLTIPIHEMAQVEASVNYAN